MARSQTQPAVVPATPPSTSTSTSPGPGLGRSPLGGGSPLLGARPRKRRPTWMLLGVVLIGLAALLGAYILKSVTDQIRVTVAARDLEPGKPITAEDLQVVEIARSNGFRAIQPFQQTLILGRSPRGPIPRLTVLNTDLFVGKGESVIPPGQVVIGAQLEPGAAPSPTMRSGDAVDLIVTRKAATSADAATVQAAKIGSGIVWAVDRPEGASASKFWVSILVPAELQMPVAQAAADNTLRLTLTGSTP